MKTFFMLRGYSFITSIFLGSAERDYSLDDLKHLKNRKLGG